MILTYPDYVHEILDHLDARPVRVWISTYNLHIGISKTGAIFDKSIAHKIVARIADETEDSRVMIGQSLVTARQYMPRMINCAEYFSSINWRYKIDSHLKSWIFFYKSGPPEAIAGGRNLGDSSWADLSLVLDAQQTRQLIAFYESLWINAKPVITSKGFAPKDGR